MVWRLLGFLKPYRRRVGALFLVSLVLSLLNVAQPALMGRLTAAIFAGGRGLPIPTRLNLGQSRNEDGKVFEFLFARPGGFAPDEAESLHRLAFDAFGRLGELHWQVAEVGQLRLRLLTEPGRQVQPGPVAEELARQVAKSLPGTGLYPRVAVRRETGVVLFPSIATVILLPAVLLLVLLMRVGVFFAQTYLGVFVTSGAMRDIRNRLYAHLQQLSLGFFERQQTGQLMSRVTNDVSTIQTFLHAISNDMLGDLLTVMAGVAYTFLIDWRLALVTVGAMGFVAGPVARVGRALRRVGGAIQARWADLTSILQETVVGMRVVKAFQLEPLMSRRFNHESESVFRAGLRWAKLTGVLTPSIEFLGGLALAVFIWFGALRVQAGQLAPDQLFTFVFMIAFIGNPVTRLSRMYGQVQHALAAGERVLELLDQRPQVVEVADAAILTQIRGEVRFENVSFAYEDSPRVLRDIDLLVRAGEILALVGPSGAGKTSLVNLLPRFYDPVAGRILIDGCDLRAMSVGSLRAQLGIVPQETLLFRATVAENIGYGKPGAAKDEIVHAAELANAHGFISALPLGYETMVGERGQTLSGGQRQRVAIARALLRDPRLLILDEATSSLDSESEALVQEALERLMQGRTTFVIAHRLSTIRRASRIAVLFDGGLVELGTHEELLALGGAYTRLYEQQFGGLER